MTATIAKPFAVVGYNSYKYSAKTLKAINTWDIRSVGRETTKRLYKSPSPLATAWRESYVEKSEVVARFATLAEAEGFIQAAKDFLAPKLEMQRAAEKAASDAREAASRAYRDVQTALAGFLATYPQADIDAELAAQRLEGQP